MTYLYLLLGVVSSYLLGSIPTSYIIARMLKGIDIRQHGSGNVGATNLMRVTGRVPGSIALVLDVLKGFVSVTVVAQLCYLQALPVSLPVFRIMLGLCSISGHVWTIFLRFKGGKGVATTIGVFIGLAPLAMLSGLGVWLITAFIFRYVSLASLAMAISLPVFMAVFNMPAEYMWVSVGLCLFIFYTHRQNVVRLLDRKEYKIGEKKAHQQE